MGFVRNRLKHAGTLEEGITLVEVIAALAVMAVVMLALAASMIRGYATLRTAKQFQQATSLGNQGIESARDLDYETLAMVDADLDPTTDTEIVTTCGSLGAGKFFDPDGTGPLNCERLVYSAAGGAIDDHQVDQTVGNESYTISRYVTWVDADSQGGTGEDYKRVVTIVDWTTGTTPRTFHASTLVYAAGKGVPVVRFELTPPDQSLIAMPDEQVTFVHTITNLGFNESFDLAMPNPTGRTWTKTFYKDVNDNGVYDSATDTALTDTNGNGTIDTGTLVTDQRIQVLTVFTLANNEASGTVTLVLTVTSKTDPSVTGQASNVLTIGDPPPLKLYLHNFPSPPIGNTNATKNLAMNEAAPTATTLFNYAQDEYSAAGRFTEETSAGASESDAEDMINWVWQAPRAITLDGDMALHLNFEVIPDNQGKCNQGFWNVYVRRKSSVDTDTGTLIKSQTNNNDAGCGKQWLDKNIDIPRTTLNSGEWLEVKVLVDKVKGPGAIWAYDTTTYDSYASFTQVVSSGS
ncbi:MAG: type IV pilus modification PilV family protein [Actinomycetota bacterium]